MFIEMVFVNKFEFNGSMHFTLLDEKERVAVSPTKYFDRIRKDGRPVTSRSLIASVVKLHCEWILNYSFYKGLRIDETLSVITKDDIVDWINFQRERGCSETTIHNREILIKKMYEWFTTEEASVRRDIPWGGKYVTRHQHKKQPRFLTVEQIITLLLGMHNESQRVATHFIFDTGVRISELIRLTRADLPKEEDYPDTSNYYPMRIPGSKSYDGSPFKFRNTIISKPMLARIRRYHSTVKYKLAKDWDVNDLNKPIFLNTHGAKLTAQSLYNAMKAAWKRQFRNPKEVSPHKLRHSTAYSVLRSEFGAELLESLIILKDMFGHEDIKTTEIYGAIPLVALQTLCQKKPMHLRYEEADEIYQKTYLPEFRNIQRRGRKK